MGDNIVDKWEFDQAVAYMDTDPLKSKALFERYLKDHPRDYIAEVYLSSVYVVLGDFDKAEEILNKIEKYIKEDMDFNSFEKKVLYYEKMSTFNRIKILIYKEKYQTLSDNYDMYMEKLNGITIKEADLISKLKTGKLKGVEREHVNGYAFKQLLEYSEEEFKEHLKKHLYEYKDEDNKSLSVFCSDFPIDKILEEIKKYIPSEKATYFGFISNTYFFKYDGCGKKDNKSTDYFEVVTIHGTSNIISMYPSNRGAKMPSVDLNYIQESNIKKKQMSKIEKFNKRYKR